jgi:hypothetical protein
MGEAVAMLMLGWSSVVGGLSVNGRRATYKHPVVAAFKGLYMGAHSNPPYGSKVDRPLDLCSVVLRDI